MDFTSEQVERYSRHILLQDIGVEGQEKISNGKVLVIGAGGLGAPALLYLAAAGVGTIGIIDNDVVDLSNLQRQVIHSTPDVGQPKVLSAMEKINGINPDVRVIACHERFTAENAADIIRDYDFIVDGSDNFSTKFLLNDSCVSAEKPFSHGGVLRFEGQTMTYVPGTACYRCVFGSPPPPSANPTCKQVNCSQAGILGSVAGILGAIQATEVLKYLTGTGDLLIDKLFSFDAQTMIFRTLKTTKNPDCPVCGNHT
jgi:molybdopterin/thiamine biosynthesis adenylyltransferase